MCSFRLYQSLHMGTRGKYCLSGSVLCSAGIIVAAALTMNVKCYHHLSGIYVILLGTSAFIIRSNTFATQFELCRQSFWLQNWRPLEVCKLNGHYDNDNCSQDNGLQRTYNDCQLHCTKHAVILASKIHIQFLCMIGPLPDTIIGDDWWWHIHNTLKPNAYWPIHLPVNTDLTITYVWWTWSLNGQYSSG